MIALFVRVAAALFAGFLSSQSVEFAQQYLQRLGGAADELRSVVARFDTSAAAEGLGRDRAVEALRHSGNALAVRQGDDARKTLDRLDRVDGQYRILREAAPIARPFLVLENPDWPLMQRALDDFRPSLPVTLDGLVLTAAGFCLGWAGGAGGHGAVRMIRRGRRRRAGAIRL